MSRGFSGVAMRTLHRGVPTTQQGVGVEPAQGSAPVSLPSGTTSASVAVRALLYSHTGTQSLTYSVDGGGYQSLPAGSSTTSAEAVFTIPGLTGGKHNVTVKDGGGLVGQTSITIASASLANAPSTGTAGTAITGVTCTLVGIATAYASLTINGSDATARVAFNAGSPVPSLSPANPATYRISIYDGPSSQANTTLLAQSGDIVVGAAGSGTSPPGTPSGITFSSATNTSLSVSWPAVPGAASYNTRYRPASSTGAWTSGPSPSSASATLTGLTAGTSYDVQVQAVNTNGTSAWSLVQTGVTTATATLTVGAGQTYTTPAAAIASNTLSGSTVMSVLPGTYAPFSIPAGLDGMIIVCTTYGHAIIDASGQSLAGGKACIYSNSAVKIDGFALKNAVGSANASGIYFESFNAAGTAVVRRCYFDANNNGIKVPTGSTSTNVSLLAHSNKFGATTSNGSGNNGADLAAAGPSLITRGNVFVGNANGDNILCQATTSSDIQDLWNVNNGGCWLHMPDGGATSITGGTYLNKIGAKQAESLEYCDGTTNLGIDDVTISSATFDISVANDDINIGNPCATWQFANCSVNWYQNPAAAAPSVTNNGTGYITGFPALTPPGGQTLPTSLPPVPTLPWES